MLAHRVRAWLRNSTESRLRHLLLLLYLVTALFDAAGKALAAHPAINRALSSHVKGASAEEMREAARPSGNFEIFRTASRHLLEQKDLYAEYPAEHSDRFKYSPSFALLFAPFAFLWWPLALFLWSSLNVLVLFMAVERALPGRAGLLALLCLHLEVLRAMQNAQSNALVAGLIILAFVALERANAWRAALAVALGACVKIFPLAALAFAIPRRRVLRTGLWAAGIGALLLALPLVVTSPDVLRAQYASWRGVESSDAVQRWFSVMELLYRATGLSLPNWPVQLAGTLALLAPIASRRDRWDDARFRFLFLCSVLLYVVLFNHQAERASFVIAFAGATLWFAGSPAATWRRVMWAIAFLTVTLMSTLIPGAIFRGPTAMLLRLCVPTLAIWLAIQWELWSRASGTELRRELDLDVALQR
ncbi:MAG: glycosyltransferase family 87 protein [Gemmatimonadaceae bacterium]